MTSFLVKKTFCARGISRAAKLWYRNTKLTSTSRKGNALSTFIFKLPSALSAARALPHVLLPQTADNKP